MSVLLDTHAFLWYVSGNTALSAQAYHLIANPTSIPFLSVASLWEMAIKISLGKLAIQAPFATFIPQQLSQSGIALLGITIDHTAQVASLPFHHRDPFDRLLIAQALTERLPILSADSAFDAYGVTRLW